MTPQEAIRLIRNLPTMCVFTDAYGEPIDSGDYYDAVDMAISALEKQIPRKIASKEDYEDCPTCGKIVRYKREGYCNNCGQKYVWTEE